MAEDRPEAGRPKKGDRFSFHYQESPQYRTVHCDGAVGAITSRGYISCTIYHERNLIPKLATREIIEAREGSQLRLGDEQPEDDALGVLRQLEVTVLFDLNSAREFFVWFKRKVAELENSAGIPENDRVTKD